MHRADDDAPGAEGVRRCVHRSTEPVGQLPGERLGASFDHDVEVLHREAEQLVAQAAANEPGGVAAAEG